MLDASTETGIVDMASSRLAMCVESESCVQSNNTFPPELNGTASLLSGRCSAALDVIALAPSTTLGVDLTDRADGGPAALRRTPTAIHQLR
jgi:hypothetical protein